MIFPPKGPSCNTCIISGSHIQSARRSFAGGHGGLGRRLVEGRSRVHLPGKRALAALLAASKCLFSSGSLLPPADPPGTEPPVGGERSGPVSLAARMGWSRPRGVVLAPVAMVISGTEWRMSVIRWQHSERQR